jgi:DNA modification methylase
VLFAPVLKKNIVAELKKFFYLPRNSWDKNKPTPRQRAGWRGA